MFKPRVLLVCVSAICVLSLVGGATVLANDGDTSTSGYESADVVGYVKHGDKVEPIILGQGCERIAPGETWAEFIDSRQMSPEEKAAIVHDVPICPVVIDGTLYKPEQIHLFDGQPLGFTVVDGTLYAFTTAKAMEKFLQEQEKPRSEERVDYAYSIFYEDWFYNGQNQLLTYATGIEIDDMSDYGMNNMISSQKIKTASGGCTLYDSTNFLGDYFFTEAGEEIPVLAWHSFNDKASSLKIYAP